MPNNSFKSSAYSILIWNVIATCFQIPIIHLYIGTQTHEPVKHKLN